MATFSVSFDWGARSETLRKLHAGLGAGQSFLLKNAALPVSFGVLQVTDSGIAWDISPVTALTVTPKPGTYTATCDVPDTAKVLRLDFDLQVKIGATTASCLEFRQMFDVGPGGSLLPKRYSIRDRGLTRGSGTPTFVTGKSPSRRRDLMGTCPLLQPSVGRLEINCEFLDVTELWWSLWAAGDRWGWYLDPDFGGTPEHTRVLAWTSGTAPMLWFAAISPQAEGNATTKAPSSSAGPKAAPKTPARTGADLVFFRPPAGINAFFYTADEAGFTAATHGDKTMFNLARWLLSPMQDPALLAKLAKVGTAQRPFRPDLAGERIKPRIVSPIAPADPIDRVEEEVLWAFKPVGIEAALARGTSPDIVLLPLGFDGFSKGEDKRWIGGGYTALTRKAALADVIASARRLLWIVGATDRTAAATPSFDRELWVAGHSAANGSMFDCLSANADAISRVISFDATPVDSSPKVAGLLRPRGIPAVTAAASTRAKAGKTLTAVFVTTPNAWKSKGAYQKIESDLVATKATVVMLPPDAEWDAYWTHPPTATSNPQLREVLSEWIGKGLDASKRFGSGGNNQWLFWHEWAVHGGHVNMTTGSPPTIASIRTFLEDALQL